MLLDEVFVTLHLRPLGAVRERRGGPPAPAAAPAALAFLAQRAAEQPAVQRRPRDDAEAVVLGGRDDLHLRAALGQVVQALLADQAEGAAPGGGLVRLGDVPAREVRGAGVEDLALLHQHVDGLPDLVPRRVPVDVVELVQVDVVGPEPFQAGVHGPADVDRRKLVVVGPRGSVTGHVAVHLGGEHDLVAPLAALGEPGADDLLGPALVAGSPVDVGRVEEVDSRVQRRVHEGVAVGLVGQRTEVHRPEYESADLQSRASQLYVLHALKPTRWSALQARRERRETWKNGRRRPPERRRPPYCAGRGARCGPRSSTAGRAPSRPACRRRRPRPASRGARSTRRRRWTGRRSP